MRDTTYHLIVAGVPDGQEEVVKSRLLEHGINLRQLSFHRFNNRNRDSGKKLLELFREADLTIMPSRTEGFGLTALQALSAGLPVLVSGNSGLGEALKEELLFGSSFVVDSEDSEVWAEKIKILREKERKIRLQETQSLRDRYANQFDWVKQCQALVEKWLKITIGMYM